MNEDPIVELMSRIAALDIEREGVSIEAFEVLQQRDPELAKQAIQALESRQAAALWLTDRIPSLRDEIPLSLLLDGQRERVMNTLKAIDHDVYT